MFNLSILLSRALLVNSSMKTRKYFFGNSTNPIDDFREKADVIVDTIHYLAALEAPTFSLDGVVYSVEDYMVPTSFQHLLKAGKIYMNTSSLEARITLNKLEPSGVRILAPSEFNMIFNDYNEGQGETQRLKLEPAHFSKGSLLSEFSVAMMEDGQMVKLDGNVVAGEALALLNIKLPLDSRFFKKTVNFNESELVSWILTQ